MSKKPNPNTLKQAELIARIIKQHYEPGRQDRNLRWIYRNHILKTYPISERTYWRYVSLMKATLKDGTTND
jgi:hypothetical protein